MEDVTRLVVVDSNGRRYDKRNIALDFSLQDDKKTLKVFVIEPNNKNKEKIDE